MGRPWWIDMVGREAGLEVARSQKTKRNKAPKMIGKMMAIRSQTGLNVVQNSAKIRSKISQNGVWDASGGTLGTRAKKDT